MRSGARPANPIGSLLQGKIVVEWMMPTGSDRPRKQVKGEGTLASNMNAQTTGRESLPLTHAYIAARSEDGSSYPTTAQVSVGTPQEKLGGNISAPAEAAWVVARRILSFHQELLDHPDPDMNANNFALIRVDDMMPQLERLLVMQCALEEAGDPHHVDIGYHYTHQQYLENIQAGGLLSQEDRAVQQVKTDHDNGASFGDGIYTANNPFAYHEFGGGEVGIFVMRLQGRTARDQTIHKDDPTIHSIHGRGEENTHDDVVVLRNPAQSAALVRFGSGLVDLSCDENLGNGMIHRYHCELQKIADECINKDLKTAVPCIVPSQVTLRCSAKSTGHAAPQHGTWWLSRNYFTGVSPTSVFKALASVKYKAPEDLRKVNLEPYITGCDCCHNEHDAAGNKDKKKPATKSKDTECSICWEVLLCHAADKTSSKRCIKLKVCNHMFHYECLEQAVRRAKRCPMCRQELGEPPQGTMPSGRMIARSLPDTTLAGHEPGVIKIEYIIDSSRQKAYHQNPGDMHGSAHRLAYLPDNAEGRFVLRRLVYAFRHGLTFTVGTSITSGEDNQVVWASIHHKTSLVKNAQYGYPDPGYLFSVNEELSALGVPLAANLPST